VSLVFRDLVTGTALYEMAEKTLPLENQKPDLKLMTTYMKGTLL
jgi:DNA-directed RNA polymerase subunit K/omega